MTEKYHLNFSKTWRPQEGSGPESGQPEKPGRGKMVSLHGRMREDIDEYRASISP